MPTKSISDEIFPSIKELSTNDELIGYKVKYNITDRPFFYQNNMKPIIRLYDYNICSELSYDISTLIPIIYHNEGIYKIN